MKALVRGSAALLWAAAAVLAVGAVASAMAQDKTTLGSDRDKVSYMVGMDVGKSIAPAGPDLDMAAFQRAVGNAFDGGEPLIAEEKVQPLAQALMQRIAARSGKAPAGGKPPEVSREQVGYLVGADVGRSLAPIKDEIDLAVFAQGVRTVLANGTPLLPQAEADALRSAFSQRIQDKLQAQAEALAGKNKAEGAAFLAKNKAVKGVFTTPSGLQYMVLRQGAGERPMPSDRVRVNYHGTLLDGTVFDSSYERGQPAEFALDQVIPGWTEGVALMPVGGKYRFWIPGELAYGAKGTPGGPIGPNATLVFDVELMAVLR
ncbi:FKBP-type peptidyl-prolyl cis-trans isomerase [Luteimonas sp. 50]|uniref:Peptidyl-prolyl cis-trans isomerase n=1 Tax=Cognatiluteimonas sedimenti TaxID=2927791 RepID=A0ABT0A1S2_9GAMM|nr:FKBP-type peptidyl-prolyl cis-trans isomerase [Lysobacter sedimenti]MCJ0824921.1 FKBP-type peptidyl-prolyl cis-trans isomerase [Lysobacter sedimenti]